MFNTKKKLRARIAELEKRLAEAETILQASKALRIASESVTQNKIKMLEDENEDLKVSKKSLMLYIEKLKERINTQQYIINKNNASGGTARPRTPRQYPYKSETTTAERHEEHDPYPEE